VAHENKIRDRIKTALEARGAWIVNTDAITRGRYGVPDLIGCYRGFFFAIEVKKPTGSKGTTPEQERELAAIKRAKGFAAVCTSEREALEFLLRIDEEASRLCGRVSTPG
jgi:Holliday junction resolvase